MIDLHPATEEVVRLLDGIDDDQLNDPTPCTGTSVAALLDHFTGLTLAFIQAARKSVPEGGS
ncbi:MAG TPA: maleylpyruvate isomerase N-terminal domain-containing protein, partial [Rugosimonospora sp.]|nr:maleylpyruvate isomerase N-terminal domain-containing protein [Rugosimonospora sp.]